MFFSDLIQHLLFTYVPKKGEVLHWGYSGEDKIGFAFVTVRSTEMHPIGEKAFVLVSETRAKSLQYVNGIAIPCSACHVLLVKMRATTSHIFDNQFFKS